MKIGKDTNLTFSLETLVSIVVTVAMGVLLYSKMATEEYVDQRIKEAMESRVVKVETKVEKAEDNLHKVDTAIELLTRSVNNHDKNMEAFTVALEKLREDIISVARRR